MNELIQQRLAAYKCQSEREEEEALKEITKEIALWALAESGFFNHVAFQGGTALRILYRLNRFSEALDFALMHVDPNFQLAPFLEKVRQHMGAYGYQLKITGKEEAGQSVRQHFLKEDSAGSLVTFQHIKQFRKSIKIKVEVDINPPAGAAYDVGFHDFPLDYPVKVFDMPSFFGSKSHALLCRSFVKGRDWYDFSWYTARQTPINFTLLGNALDQLGPWRGKKVKVNLAWYLAKMTEKIESIDWKEARKDVERFLRASELKPLELWSADFFSKKLHKWAAAQTS